jgi:hypothetical protein
MSQKRAHHNHTFVMNFFGALGYSATIFVWLLVIETISVLLPIGSQINDVSSDLSSSINTATYSSQASPVVQSQASLRFLLIIALIICTWVFCYMAARASSRTLRHLLKLYGRKESIGAIFTIKYLGLIVGLIGVVILLQFVPDAQVMVKFPISFLGLIAGIVAAGSIWLQRIMAVRHRVAASHVL